MGLEPKFEAGEPYSRLMRGRQAVWWPAIEVERLSRQADSMLVADQAVLVGVAERQGDSPNSDATLFIVTPGSKKEVSSAERVGVIRLKEYYIQYAGASLGCREFLALSDVPDVQDPTLMKLVSFFIDEFEELSHAYRGGELGHLAHAIACRAVDLSAAEYARRSKSARAAKADKLIAEVDAYISQNLHRRVTLGDLAEVAQLSPHHFLRVFKAKVGLTPQAYSMRRRVYAARDLLLDTNQSAADIAAATGFSSQSHMNGAFRSVLSCTPGDVRRRVSL